MEDLISRKAALDALKDQWTPESTFNMGLGQAEYVIANKVPTVDAEPVRHGRFVKRKDGALIHWDCSECGIGYLDNAGLDKLRYCPHCGARMDGGVTDG